MEAMNADLPIVATNVGDNDLLVKDEVNGFLCGKREWKCIADKLEVLIKDNILCKTKGKESKFLLQKEYSVEKFKNAYVKLLKEIGL